MVEQIFEVFEKDRKIEINLDLKPTLVARFEGDSNKLLSQFAYHLDERLYFEESSKIGYKFSFGGREAVMVYESNGDYPEPHLLFNLDNDHPSYDRIREDIFDFINQWRQE
jgi:hypothetical protein